MPESGERLTAVPGQVPAASFIGYAAKLSSYTGGEGRLWQAFSHYAPCADAEARIEESGYFADTDQAHPSSSVFCSHGAGVIVPWDRVREYMHVDTGWRPGEDDLPEAVPDDEALLLLQAEAQRARLSTDVRDERSYKERQRDFEASEAELMRIFEKTYGPVRKRDSGETGPREYGEGSGGETGREPGISDPAKEAQHRRKPSVPDGDYLLVDGYNIIYAWEDLRALAVHDIKAARDRLIDILSNYAGYRREEVILVFDAYRVSGGQGAVYRAGNIDVVFTKEAETADLYIEKTSHRLSRNNRVTVATSDAIEQMIIFSGGALRMSADGLREAVRAAEQEIRERWITE